MITEKEVIDFLKFKVETDNKWALRALMTVYGNQTSTEQSYKETIDLNGIGFNSFDAKILTSIAKQFKSGKRLSKKQLNVVKRAMPKYWQQVYSKCDKHILTRTAEIYKEQFAQQGT